MKSKIQFLGLIALVMLAFFSCNKESKNTEQHGKESINHHNADSTNANEKIDFKSEQKVAKDTIKKLFDELKKIPVDKSLSVGEMKIKTLKYKSFEVGDFIHHIFVDEYGNEYDLNSNNTDIKLSEDDVEINKKYLNKKFVVVWRSVQQKNPAKDDSFGDYVWNEILYLKQVKK